MVISARLAARAVEAGNGGDDRGRGGILGGIGEILHGLERALSPVDGHGSHFCDISLACSPIGTSS